MCVDITDRKLAERELRDADRRKDEFLATLSHELRNPLAPIRTALEIMRLAGDNTALLDKARTTMERQLAHLVRLTDDLLDVSRITQDKVELRRERLDLRSVLLSAIEATQPMLDAQGHSLTLDLQRLPMWTDGDTFHPCPPRCAAYAAPVPSTARPPPPLSPVKFSGLIERVSASARRQRLDSPTPIPFHAAISFPFRSSAFGTASRRSGNRFQDGGRSDRPTNSSAAGTCRRQ